MSDSKEFNASSVEKAAAKASEKLGVPADSLSYEIVDTGSDGFLGIGARDARIKVSVPSPETTESDDCENSDSDDAPPPPSFSEGDDYSPVVAEPSSQTEFIVTGESGEDLDSEADREERITVDAPEDLIEEVRSYVSSVMDAMGLESRLDVYDTDEYIAVDIVSDHTALIIGQKGETIDSLQYLANSAIYKDREFVKRVVLDSEGYRQRRIGAIQGMAHRTARKSIREQRDIEMPPMSASERRVVHVYLKENPDVSTFSEGSGSDRRVTVSPNHD
ncbi:MAG: Jag N-terminal domain-containing protein [Actinomycetota bacterium]|nr:Jag N-terminal domain-containing protein [Rubrobacter sp.]MDQ3509826.1 Jag N-terminal domain-containing protein [Actinomycetota bacterium]